MIDKLKKNKGLIIFLVIITVIMILIFTIMNRCSRKMIDEVDKNDKKIYQTEEVKKQLSVYNYDETKIIINDLAEKGSDWSRFPLSQKFLSKYNNNEGIFPEYKDYYDTTWNFGLYGKNDIINNRFDVQYGINWYLNPKEDRPKDNYYRSYDITVTFLVNDKGEIDDIIKGEPDIIYDNGEYIKKYDNELKSSNFINILADILFYDHNIKLVEEKYDPIDVNKEPCSKRFSKKIFNADKDRVFIDFFDKLDFQYGLICWKNDLEIEQVFKNNDLYCTCGIYDDNFINPWESIPIKNYLYKVDFYLDSEKKLDDLKVTFLREISNDELINSFLPVLPCFDVYNE